MPDHHPAPTRAAKTAFAFYGRVGCDAPARSADRQLVAAEELLRERRWRIVSAYLDVPGSATRERRRTR
jgi:hypothetical protein